MAVGLFLVALVMIAGGGYAAIEGYGIILNERGWSMVIAGTVAATGGLLLFGAALIAGRLKAILRELTRTRERMGRLDETGPAPLPEGPADLAQTRLDPPIAMKSEAAAPVGMTAAAAAARAGLSRRGVPSARLVSGPADEALEHAVAGPADALLETPREPVQPGGPGVATPVAANDGVPTTASGDEASVVGTYNSGGNAYVMFSNGSIEADTPTGRYRFKSLEELKEFIANGGEEGLGATRAP